MFIQQPLLLQDFAAGQLGRVILARYWTLISFWAASGMRQLRRGD
jgi:hypothetical protein